METDLTKGVHHRHRRYLTDRTLTLAAAHIDERETNPGTTVH
jgi:hypothetical protein